MDAKGFPRIHGWSLEVVMKQTTDTFMSKACAVSLIVLSDMGDHLFIVFLVVLRLKMDANN